MNQMTKRAARAAMHPVLLGAEEARRQRTAYGVADGWLARPSPDFRIAEQRKNGLANFLGSSSLHTDCPN